MCDPPREKPVQDGERGGRETLGECLVDGQAGKKKWGMIEKKCSKGKR